MGLTFLRGRNFNDADRYTDEELNHAGPSLTGAAIVNMAFASRYSGAGDPVGRVIVLGDAQSFGSTRTIVGVVADAHQRSVAERPRPTVFAPHAQHPDMIRPSLVVRSLLPLESVAPVIRERLRQFEPHLVVLDIRPMDDVIAGTLSRPRFNAVLIGAFAALGLALAAIGIYGVVAFMMTRRSREIGIRIALGARAADVLRLVIADGMMPVLVGTVVGVLADLAATRALRSMLFGVTPLDAVSLAAGPALLTVIALLACYLPARRALRVDPLTALRED
jgi:putative ABC transport system permease protein